MFKVGVDIGGTGIKAGIIKDNKLVDKKTIPTDSHRPYIEVVKDTAALIAELCNKHGAKISALKGVGVGTPGSLDSERGVVIYSNNIKWQNVPFGAELSKLLGVPVRLENDANVAALGEHKYGSHRFNSSILITLGTGVGSGVIIDGKIFSGFKGAGTEIGHSVIIHGGEICTCGRRGCLEAYASATALIRDTKRAMDRYSDSLMWKHADSLDKVNGKTVFDAAKDGDVYAKELIAFYIEVLAEGVTNIINAFRPEAVFFGGGVAAQGEVLLAPLREICTRRAYGSFSFAPFKILSAELGNDAGIMGAASLFD